MPSRRDERPHPAKGRSGPAGQVEHRVEGHGPFDAPPPSPVAMRTADQGNGLSSDLDVDDNEVASPAGRAFHWLECRLRRRPALANSQEDSPGRLLPNRLSRPCGTQRRWTTENTAAALNAM